MRYAILSDVHGNIEALRAVLDELRPMDIDFYAFLGDAVGYGASPNEVCSELRQLADVAVLGNHDAAISGRMDYADYYAAARRALDWCKAQLTYDNLAWLKSLPYRATHAGIEFVHGAPFDPPTFDYIFTSDQITEQLEHLADLERLVFMGHSHLTLAFEVRGSDARPLAPGRIYCQADASYIVTVGSVGQPRDRDPRACCGIYDSTTRLFTHHRVAYDTRQARRKIIDAGLPSTFGDRLLLGI